MKMKTKELTGAELDWAVAKCEGHINDWNCPLYDGTVEEISQRGYHPSSNWVLGGQIIDREKISVLYDSNECWVAYQKAVYSEGTEVLITGKTALEAAMRCFVYLCTGQEIDILADSVGD